MRRTFQSPRNLHSYSIVVLAGLVAGATPACSASDDVGAEGQESALAPVSGFRVSAPLVLDGSNYRPGDTVRGSATYVNSGSTAATIQRVTITAREPGKGPSQGPFDDFTPGSAAITVPPHASVTLHGSFVLPANAALGTWTAYTTFQDANGWHDATPMLSFAVAAAPSAATSCFPYADPSTATLRASSHKVFAHYFSPYTISLDNKDPSNDIYAHTYLSDTFNAAYGGLLRDRPLPQAPRTESNWEELNLEEEVRRAIALGLDGFTYDVLSLTPGNHHWDTLVHLLEAANHVDPGFKIVLMPDMNAGWASTNPTGIVAAIASIASSPALYRDASGAIVLSAFKADNQTASWWQAQLAALSTLGVKTSFVPLNLNLAQNNFAFVTSFAPISAGLADWGAAFATAASGLGTHTTYLHDRGKFYMFPVTPQSFRPNQQVYWEANNSQTLQKQMQSAIASGADWVQLVTWNDYSESTQIAPSVGTGWAYYDLTGYYLRWFKTGAPPAITKDALYYFHRKSLSTTPPNKQSAMFRVPAGPAPSDDVELVAFLETPGTLEIAQGSTVAQKDVGAGLQTFTVPIEAGTTPAFRLLRGGVTAVQLTSATPVVTSIDYEDLAYRGGTSVSCARILR